MPPMENAASLLKVAMYVGLPPLIVACAVPISITSMLVVTCTCASETGLPLLSVMVMITVLLELTRAGWTCKLTVRLPAFFVCMA